MNSHHFKLAKNRSSIKRDRGTNTRDDGVEIIEDAKVLRLKPFTQLGTPMEIIKGAFGGKAAYEAALRELEDQIYEQVANE